MEISGRDSAPMVLVSAGEFLYGDNNQRMMLPAFYMDRYEVTVSRYASFLQVSGLQQPRYWNQTSQVSAGDRPVIGVDWYDADAYCRRYGKRLPTDQEWEKAARGTGGRKYPWGDEEPTNRHANFGKDLRGNYNIYSDKLVGVGSFDDGKSPYGIYDLAGSVSEWTSSSEGEYKVIRGGSWDYNAVFLRATIRSWLPPTTRGDTYGFRCVQDVPE